MRTIELGLDKLAGFWSELEYLNKKEERVRVLQSVNYHFSHPGIDFHCSAYLDDNIELGMTHINGETPNIGECFITNEFTFGRQAFYLNLYLIENYGFSPCGDSLYQIDACVDSNASINYKDEKVDISMMYLTDTKLHLLGRSKEYVDYIDENYIDTCDAPNNVVKSIDLLNITDVEYDFAKNKSHFNIYIDNGDIYEFKEVDFEPNPRTIKMKNRIKKAIHILKYKK